MRTLTTAALAAALILTPSAALATPGHDPVTICHKPGTPAEHEITIDRDALNKHLEHGDTVGACEVVTIPTPVPSTEPTTQPTTQPTTEPTEEPTWEPTAPPTETPSPEPVNPEPKPNDEPTPVPPGTPIEHGSETSAPSSPSSNPSTSIRPEAATPAPSPSSPESPTTPVTPSPSSTASTTTLRPELAETGFNRGLIALAASMVAAGAAIFLGSRWRRS